MRRFCGYCVMDWAERPVPGTFAMERKAAIGQAEDEVSVQRDMGLNWEDLEAMEYYVERAELLGCDGGDSAPWGARCLVDPMRDAMEGRR